jgi:glycosyltransferase involved in cell wall biosynthesis
VHDLAILRAPEAFPRWHRLYGRTGLTHVLRSADAIVAVSEFTRAETVELAGVPAERIRVVPHGVDPVFTPEGPRADGEYVLAVATLEPRKNLGTLVEAFALLAETGLSLAVAGGQGWGEQPQLDRPGIVRLGRVSDEELARLYRGAAAVVYPSRFEGFGMPIVEAMASGAPVVASAHPSLDEASGTAAVRADPESPQAIADAVREALARRDELRAAGLEHARAFTWRRVGEIFLEGYERFA